MLRVMIVDDEPQILDGLESILPWEEYGLELQARKTNGFAALEAIKTNPVDILITDVKMPEMSGLELIQCVSLLPAPPKTVIISAFDDFAYVKKAIVLGVENYLLKPINRNELSETLLKLIDDIEKEKLDSFVKLDHDVFRENILNRWIAGSIQMHELQDRAEMVHINTLASQYQVVLFKPLSTDKVSHNAIPRIINESLLTFLSGEIFSDTNGNYVLLLNGQDLSAMKPKIRCGLQSFFSTVMKEVTTTFFVTIGKCVDGAEAVQDAFRTAEALLSYRLLKPDNTIVFYDDVQKNDMPEFLDYQELEKLMLSGIEKIEDYLMAYLARLSAASALQLPKAKYALLHVIFQLLQLLKRRFPALNSDLTMSERFAELDTIQSFDELQQWIIALLRELQDSIQVQNNRNPLLHTILSYMHQNYMEELSLKDLSVKYNINASYLGQLFKSETGELFSAYINRIRLEQAEKMLTSTSMKIGDIALAVGYKNISYFNHYFKLQFGKTPNHYRQPF